MLRSARCILPRPCTQMVKFSATFLLLINLSHIYSKIMCTAVEPENDDSEPYLDEFDKNLPQTVTLLRHPNGAKVYVIGTGHFSLESQNDVSKVCLPRS